MTHIAPAANSVKVIENCRVSPPSGAVADQFLPLTFFDIQWLPLPPLQKLLFYEFHHSKAHFIETLIPHLKHSLSLTLKHFFPFTSNMIIPSSNSSKPQIRYVEGDSVSVTFSESSDDFNYLTGNQPRNADQFYPLIPQIPEIYSTNVSGSGTIVVVPLAALQVTVFPESGICFGFAYHHVLADGKAFNCFMKSWASVAKFGGDAELLAGGYLPFCDRTMIKDPTGLDTIFLSQVCGERKLEELCQTQCPPRSSNNNVRATFVISRTDVQRLKDSVMAHRGQQHSTVPLLHVSTFTVTCAYMWVCILKTRASTSVDKDVDEEDELDHFVVAADCRERLDPPIPATYFGNCLAPCFVTARHGQLMEEKEGFFVAVELFGEAIDKRLHKGEPEGVLKASETWLSDFNNLNMRRLMSLTGSPKIGIYEPDFGWGRPRKSEIVSIDITGGFSISECRDSQGDVEFGVTFPKIAMDAFASIFANGLKLL
ncbi:phenolic glucoside malonyltransferase 1-like [Cornus florida]|uniref:phenolic glucoside malonyltransferase 1-like n=1 Tax=Cornus florida TaxID=4283 RepID=UPI00289CC175|nr:phenolic glucoside malonyltransferase 1-like [Cornus florida]